MQEAGDELCYRGQFFFFFNVLATYLNYQRFPNISVYMYPFSERVSLAWPQFGKLLSEVLGTKRIHP